MGHTNSTANYNLPQFIGTDKPTWLGDVNGAMSAIDAAIATAASAATDAASVATNAATVAAGAVTTANAASETATAASTAAGTATSTANTAADTANNAQSTAVSAYNKAATVGDVAELTTTDKTSAVAAINEVNAGVATIGDLSDLTTTDKTSVVAAINEVVSELPSAGGSVSVTADGVKTIKTLLDELYALVDFTKIKSSSFLRRRNATTGNYINYFLTTNSVNGMLHFSGLSIAAATYELSTIVMSSNASSWNKFNAPSTYSDQAVTVDGAGYIYEIIY